MALLKASTAKKGFTLIEVTVVLGLLAILGGLSMLMSMEMYRGNSFDNERDTLVSVLQRARAQAMDNVCLGTACADGKEHGVYIQTDTSGNAQNYIIFQGLNYNASDATNEIIPASSNGIHFEFNPPTIQQAVFDRLSGDALAPGDIKLAGDGAVGSTISLNSEGRISWTN